MNVPLSPGSELVRAEQRDSRDGDCRRRSRLCRCSRSPSSITASPIVKNTCSWITSDESPAGMPSFIPRNRSPNCSTPIATP